MNKYEFPSSGCQRAINEWARVALARDNPDIILRALDRGLRNQLLEYRQGLDPVFLLDHAIFSGHRTTVDLLLSDARIDVRMGAPVFYAAQENSAMLVRRLIAQGADISASGLYNRRLGMTALHIANLRMSKLLVDLGADLAAVNSFGHDAITAAIIHQNIKKFFFLLSVDTRNINRRIAAGDRTTLFELALKERCSVIVQVIMQQKNLDIFTDATEQTYDEMIMCLGYGYQGWVAQDVLGNLIDLVPGDIDRALMFKRFIELGADMDAISRRYLEIEEYPALVCMALVCGASFGTCSFQHPMYWRPSGEESRRLVTNWCMHQQRKISATLRQSHLGVTIRRLLRTQVDLIRARATEVLIGLQTLNISAGELLEVVEFACEPFSNCVPPHIKWQLIVTVKHYHDRVYSKVSTT